MKKILLVEPKRGRKYYTTYPPLGLLKLAAYHKSKKDSVELVAGFSDNGFDPDIIYITSLFTYAYEPVHDVIKYYSEKHTKADIIVGGIYASLCSDHLQESFGDRIQIHEGLFNKIDNILPDYSLVPAWESSIIFSSRGCVRKCSFCSVPVLEPKFTAQKTIKHLMYPGHKDVIIWDNNILASPYWSDIFYEIEELNLKVDFNQGVDARLINEEVATRLGILKTPFIRLAYDNKQIRQSLKKAIDLLKSLGINGRKILVYCLYNTDDDTPSDLLDRIRDLLEWNVVSYPMRYEPLDPRPKNTYISSNWSAGKLEMIADARRVIGYGGAFPPYKGLKKKISDAKDFQKAFELRPKRN